MSFRHIRDQETAIRLLTNMVKRRRVPNGLLFWGPGGVGKRLAAFEMAKAVNCLEGMSDPCDRCSSCRKVMGDNHPDVRVIIPLKKSRNINVEAINGVNELASLRPYESPRRVFVFLDADRMGPPAQNHFLKTLEEPPGGSVFILVTEFPRMLLPTIRSRCESVRFRVLQPQTVTDLLRQERDLDTARAEAIANLAQGQMSRALDLVDSEKRDIVLAITARLAQGEDPVTLAEEFAKRLEEERKRIDLELEADLGSEEGDDLTREDLEALKEERVAQREALIQRDMLDYLYLLETWYRDELVHGTSGSANRILNRDRLAILEKGVSSDPVLKIEALEKARGYLDRYVKEERVFIDLFFALAAK